MPEIVEWGAISDRFEDGLLLGNGASISIHPGFAYTSLFDAATERGHITPPVAEVFRRFGVTDFELVLRRLWQAKLVNEALDIPAGRVEAAYSEVRSALIATVRDIHVSYDDAAHHLPQIYKFLKKFKTVISLNYDLIVYWAAMLGNRDLGTWFKDCFHNGSFHEEWDRLRAPYRAQGATLFFYPHGNLALTRTDSGDESKLSAREGDLLGSILDQWSRGRVVPLFVCEGTSMQKKLAIDSSSYLQRVYREVIPSIGESLVIYGWGMSEQEQHILDQLSRVNIRRVGVSVWGNDQAYAQRVEEKLRMLGIPELLFFDSTSDGCWINIGPADA